MGANMFQTFNYGSAVQSGQQIQRNRLQNQALAEDEQSRKNILQNREKALKIRSTYDKMPDQIAALERESMFDQADELRNNYIGARANEVKLLTTLRDSINGDNYKSFRQDLLQAGAVTPDMMPVEYSDDWFRKQADDKKRTLDKFTVDSFRNGANMSKDYVTENGEVRYDLTGEWYEDVSRDPKDKGGAGTGKGKGFEFKAADTNAIGKQAERLFGGFYDPATGRLSGLDPDLAARVQAVQAEAEKIYTENAGYLTHAVAVARAARKLKINVENVRDKAATDPLNLRQ